MEEEENCCSLARHTRDNWAVLGLNTDDGPSVSTWPAIRDPKRADRGVIPIIEV